MTQTIKVPDTLVIIFAILCMVVLLTWLVPAGSFAMETKQGREVLVPGSYSRVASQPQGVGALLMAPVRGFISAAQIIAFVFIVGGSIFVVSASGAIDAGLQRLVAISARRPAARRYMVVLLIVMFSLAGATFGMSEEVIAFVIITIPLAHSLGYDTLTGVFIPFVGAGAGFAGAFSNPFTIGIAQGIADLPPFSGYGYRLLIWACFTLLTVVFMLWYLRKISRDPSKAYRSAVGNDLEAPAESLDFDGRRRAVLIIFLLTIVVLVLGVAHLDWYITEIAGLFFGMAILTGVVARMHPNRVATAFAKGAKEMMTAALVIGFSKGILIVAQDGKIIDTILHALAGSVEGLHRVLAAEAMFGVQTAINFFLPSGSGQAALTMPIMAPLSDLLGITRQTAVLAFQLGDGLSNMIIPTSGVTMGVLSIAKIPYQVWVRWMAPLMLLYVLLAMAVLVPAVLLEWGPY